jgi:hypothetical protein
MAALTLLDLAKASGNDKITGLIEENLSYAPEFRVVPARTIKGTTYKTLTRTGFPSVGFRTVNSGVTPTKSTFKEQLVQAFLFGGRVEIDKGLLQASEDGEDYLKSVEASGVMQQALLTIGSQFYYGDVATSGFPGLKSLVDSSLVLDATGSSAGAATSVYGVKFGPQAVQFVLGGGEVLSLSPFREETLTDADGKKFPGEVADLSGWIGLQSVSKYAIGRICNLTAQTGKGLTDALVAAWLAKFPVGYRPDALFLNRQSAYQLQVSRSTVNAVGKKTSDGAENWAPAPTESNGVPIVVTDSIVSTEAIVS